MAILVIIVLLAAPEYQRWVAAAGEARCISNMRSLHVALGTYLNDNNQIWPQGPSPLEGDSWAQFWYDTLQPQGIGLSTWQCPTLRGLIKDEGRGERITEASLHYVPTMFDPTRGIAWRWPTQPWLIERADAHGNGALLCFTDGSIKSFNKVLAEQGLR